MWEQLFLFCLLLFFDVEVEASEAELEPGSEEKICENGKTLPVIPDKRTNSSTVTLNTEDISVCFHQIGIKYTGSDARQGLSVAPNSQLIINMRKVLGKVKTLYRYRDDLVANFGKLVTWVNQWWQALSSVFKSWLPLTDRQGSLFFIIEGQTSIWKTYFLDDFLEKT